MKFSGIFLLFAWHFLYVSAQSYVNSQEPVQLYVEVLNEASRYNIVPSALYLTCNSFVRGSCPDTALLCQVGQYDLVSTAYIERFQLSESKKTDCVDTSAIPGPRKTNKPTKACPGVIHNGGKRFVLFDQNCVSVSDQTSITIDGMVYQESDEKFYCHVSKSSDDTIVHKYIFCNDLQIVSGSVTVTMATPTSVITPPSNGTESSVNVTATDTQTSLGDTETSTST